MMEHTLDLQRFTADLVPVAEHRPWPRFVVIRERWLQLIALPPRVDWSLLGLWGEPAAVHAAFREESGL
jgi:hypothetical protein